MNLSKYSFSKSLVLAALFFGIIERGQGSILAKETTFEALESASWTSTFLAVSTEEEAIYECEKFAKIFLHDDRPPVECSGPGSIHSNPFAWFRGWSHYRASPVFTVFGFVRATHCGGHRPRVIFPLDGGVNSLLCAAQRDYWFVIEPSCHVCPVFGNPIQPGTGRKTHSEALIRSANFPSLSIGYDSRMMIGRALDGLDFAPRIPGRLGGLWTTNLHRGINLQHTEYGALAAAQVSRGNGQWVSFAPASDGRWTSVVQTPLKLESDGVGGYRLRDLSNGTVESYSDKGQLREIQKIDGSTSRFIYSDSNTNPSQAPRSNLLIQIDNHFGGAVRMSYGEINTSDGLPRLKQVTGPDGESVEFEYAEGHLSSIRWPDDSARTFVYEDANHPWALSGIIDEQNARHSTYRYDAQGRAVETQLAGGVNHFRLNWTKPPAWQMVENYDPTTYTYHRFHYLDLTEGAILVPPVGPAFSLEYALVNGSNPVLRSRSQDAGSGSPASTSQQDYDPNGNLAWREDFNGHKACFANDLSRNLEVVRVEGLAKGSACDATAANAVLPAGSRKTSTQWHPDWHLATKTAEPGRIVTRVYNGQPDPFAGGAVASCAPSTALLPDGKPIVVLCKEVGQASTDVNGSKGFAAVLAATPARAQSWTYNRYGQVLTHDGPRTDVADITTYEYYPSTDANWTMGDLKQVTNPAGQITRFTQYNRAGKLLQMIDPNGIVTDSTYDLRQRLKSVSVAGATTAYDYHPTGLLKQVTEPDASWVGYEYDAAHRLVALKDSRGNRIDYTLDNAGNRTAEKVSDPQGALKRSAQRSFDALGRLEQLTGRE